MTIIIAIATCSLRLSFHQRWELVPPQPGLQAANPQPRAPPSPGDWWEAGRGEQALGAATVLVSAGSRSARPTAHARPLPAAYCSEGQRRTRAGEPPDSQAKAPRRGGSWRQGAGRRGCLNRGYWAPRYRGSLAGRGQTASIYFSKGLWAWKRLGALTPQRKAPRTPQDHR